MDLFSVLGGKIGDLIKRRAEYSLNNSDYRKIFERKLRRILEEIRYLEESAVAIAVTISPEELQSKFLVKFQTELREVDEMWVFRDNRDHQVFLLLLPYTDEEGANKFLYRTELSKLPVKTVCHELDRKIFNYCDDDVRVCMWILEKKTAPEKVFAEIDQFCKSGYIDVTSVAKSNAGISSFA